MQKQHPAFCNAISKDLLFRQVFDRGIVVNVAQRESYLSYLTHECLRIDLSRAIHLHNHRDALMPRQIDFSAPSASILIKSTRGQAAVIWFIGVDLVMWFRMH